MNVNLDPSASDGKRLRTTRRTAAVLGVLLLLAGGLWGGWWYINHSTEPAVVRWRLDRYLAKHGKAGDLKTAFAFPSKADMQRKVVIQQQKKGARTGKTFEVLQEEYCTLTVSVMQLDGRLSRVDADLRSVSNRVERLEKSLAAAVTASATNVSLLQSNLSQLRARRTALVALQGRRGELADKTKALESITADLWDFQRNWASDPSATPGNAGASLAKARSEFISETEQALQAAESYAGMYTLLGKELWVAGKLLESNNAEHRREGVLIAMAASRQALNHAINGWVAARICEGYILPGFDVADPADVRSPLHIDRLIAYCADTFRRNNEFGAAAEVLETGLANALSAGDSRRADRARWEIAACYEQAGDPKRALTMLKQMKDPSNRGVARRIAMLEREVSGN